MWRSTQDAKEDKRYYALSLAEILIKKTKKTKNGCRSLISSIGKNCWNCLDPMPLLNNHSHKNFGYNDINRKNLNKLKKINKKVQVICSIGREKADNIKFFNRLKFNKFALDGISEDKTGVWVWISDHFYDPDMSLLLITMDPLTKNFDTRLLPLVCFLSNVIIWNMRENQYDGLEDMMKIFKFLIVAKEDVEKSKNEDITIDYPFLQCVCHESDVGGFTQYIGWNQDKDMGQNDAVLENFLDEKEVEPERKKLKSVIKECFKEKRGYYRIPKKEHKEYKEKIVYLEGQILETLRETKKLWGMEISVEEWAVAFEIYMIHIGRGTIANPLSRLREEFEQSIVYNAISHIDTIKYENLLVCNSSDIDRDIEHGSKESTRDINSKDQEKIKEYVKNTLVHNVVEKVFTQIDNIKLTNALPPCHAGAPLPPVAFFRNSSSYTINERIKKIASVINKTNSSSSSKQVVVLTTLGVSPYVKGYLFPMFLFSYRLFQNISPAENMPTVFIGKCVEEENKIVFIIDFPSHVKKYRDIFCKLLPLLFLVSNAFIISSDDSEYLDLIRSNRSKLHSPAKNPQTSNSNSVEDWISYKRSGRKRIAPHVLWISKRGKPPDCSNEIFGESQLMHPEYGINQPSKLNALKKNITNDAVSRLEKMVSSEFLINILDLYMRALNQQKGTENEWKFLISLLPATYKDDLKKEVSNYRQYTDYNGSKTPEQLLDTHKEYKMNRFAKIDGNEQDVVQYVFDDIVGFLLEKEYEKSKTERAKKAERECLRILKENYLKLKTKFDHSSDSLSTFYGRFEGFTREISESLLTLFTPENVAMDDWEKAKKKFRHNQVIAMLFWKH